MKLKILLLLSIGANLGMGLLLLRPKQAPQPYSSAIPMAPTNSIVAALLPSSTPTRPAFYWSQIESTNYPEYVANLRAIGCPEQTLRDIILADVRAALQSAKTPQASADWSVWKGDPEGLVDYLMRTGSLGEKHGIAGEPQLGAAFQVSSDIKRRNVAGTGPGLPEYPSTGGAAIDGRTPLSEVQDPAASDTDAPSTNLSEAQQAQRLAMARESWAQDFVRSHYGHDTFLDWERSALQAGMNLESYLANLQIRVPEQPGESILQ